MEENHTHSSCLEKASFIEFSMAFIGLLFCIRFSMAQF